MPCIKRAKTKPPVPIKYRACDVRELQKFVLERTGNLRRKKNKAACIQKLQQRDRSVTFRFLDMLPELRNRIYELLLCHNSDVYPMIFADTALLRTCRQIHNEARGILYAQSLIYVNHEAFGEEMEPHWRGFRKIHLHIPRNGFYGDAHYKVLQQVVKNFDINNSLEILYITVRPVYVDSSDFNQFKPLLTLPVTTRLVVDGLGEDTAHDIAVREALGVLLGREIEST